MAEFIFTSPGVKFRERDLTFVTRNVGLTTLGVVGETEKGPAFEPVFIQDKTQFRTRFGRQNLKRFPNGELQYHLPYVANSYLEESNQLYVTRILGLSGFDAGKAWAVTLSAGPDMEQVVSGSSTTTTEPLQNGEYLGVSLQSLGATGSVITNFQKNPTTNEFTWNLHEFVVTDYDPVTGDGEVDDTVTQLSAPSLAEYENMVLAVIRSRGRVQDVVNEEPITTFDATEVEITENNTITTALYGNNGDLFGNFKLLASQPSHPNDTSSDEYVVSLNPSSSNFISNVLGRSAKDKNTKLWVESTFPDLIRKLDADGIAYAINTVLIEADSDVFTNYKTGFKTPETPWVVSQLRGNRIDRLFRFISISDGDTANREIKISIVNINPTSLEFDVLVRDFNDTDASPIVLESFNRCSLVRGLNTFIGNRIGTVDDEFPLRSNYIMLELAEDISEDSFPAGFEGYWFNNFEGTVTGDGTTDGIPPKIMYKKTYLPDERLRRVYLGVSELAYSAVGLTGRGINQNFFNFNNFDGSSTNFVKTKGFHLDVEATGTTYVVGQFEVGAGRIQSISDIVDPTSPYNDINSRKFTLVPAGGFDGWDVHRNGRSNTDLYRKGGIYDGVPENETPTNDFQAWETAIATFNNPENVTINVFATPGINWSDHNILVRDTIEMIENQRADSLYVIDSPDINIPQIIGADRNDVQASRDIVGLLESTNIDSNYSCTYFPWIQMRDAENGVNIYLPPTGEVVAAIAFTDKSTFPWFAPAGLQRGVTNARRSRYRLSQEARDILYKGRLNPLADFADTGTAIFGQKTLQVRESALDRINVRRLLLQVKVLISNIAIRLVFEQNDQTTIDQFLAKATPILDNIKRERGLFDFQIKMDDSINTPETRDRNELYGEISLKPTRSVEYIGITFNITPSGASFEDI